MIRIFKFLMVFLLTPQFVLACQQCFGANVNNATTQGIGFAMLALLGITGFVSTGIVMFFLNMKKRSKLHSFNHGILDSAESKTERMDKLLDKINVTGYKGLSPQEKEFLKSVATKMDG